MKSIYFALILINLYTLVGSIPVFAQLENVWAFGENAGLDFNNPGMPTPLLTAAQSGEASASVCDADGQLLFYTDGINIYDRLHNLMFNGSALTPPTWNNAHSSHQGALIVPVIGHPTQYYVFSNTAVDNNATYNTTTYSRLYYSVVDMSLSGGMGEVLPNEKGKLLDSGLAENITAVIGDRCNIWLLTYDQHREQFKAYSIDASGLNTVPVLSTMDYGRGYGIAFSTDRRKIAHKISRGGGSGAAISLSDFNPATGIVSSSSMEIPFGAYALCFSPDNTKLYASEPGMVFQYDLSLGGLQNIINSRILVCGSYYNSDLKLGPDGKIYFNAYTNGFLSVINEPNSPGLACQAQSSAISLVAGSKMFLGLPNVVPAFKRDTVSTTQVATSCNEPVLLAPEDTSGWDYIWQDGLENPTRQVTTSGTYWVRYYSAPCVFRTDTFEVEILEPAFHSMTEVICSDASFSFGDTVVQAPGIYYDTLEAANGCDSVIKLDLIVVPAPEVSVSLPEGRLCIGDSIALSASGTDQYEWHYDGQSSGGASFTAHLKLAQNELAVRGISSNECAVDTTIKIDAVPCCDLFVPNAFSPNGDGVNDVFKPESAGHLYNYRLEIFNRWGQRIFSSVRMENGWSGEAGGGPLESGTYYYFISADCYGGGVVDRKGDLTLVR